MSVNDFINELDRQFEEWRNNTHKKISKKLDELQPQIEARLIEPEQIVQEIIEKELKSMPLDTQTLIKTSLPVLQEIEFEEFEDYPAPGGMASNYGVNKPANWMANKDYFIKKMMEKEITGKRNERD